MIPQYIRSAFFHVRDATTFFAGVSNILKSIRPEVGAFTGDNLITFGRNLSFLSDERFMSAVSRHAETEIEQSTIWRMAVVAWGFRNGLRLEGDFVECACYKGVMARVVAESAGLKDHPERRYYLYDLFEHDPSMPHHAMSQHGPDLFEAVKQRFSDLPNVVVTRGRVPQILEEVAPEKIAFMHLDLNNAEAEIGALEVLFDRMVPGAVMVLDDYGWLFYRQQKTMEDSWFADRGYRVLELPTGQGLLIK